MVVVAGAVWAVVTYVWPRPRGGSTGSGTSVQADRGSVAVGGSVDGPINLGGSGSTVIGGDIRNVTININLPAPDAKGPAATFGGPFAKADDARAEDEASQRADKLGIPLEAVTDILRLLDEQKVARERQPLVLAQVTELRRGQDQRLPSPEPAIPEVAGLLQKALQALQDRRLDEADALLARAEEADLAAARQARAVAEEAAGAADRRQLRAAAARAERAQTAWTRLHYREAAAHFAAAAALVPPGQDSRRVGYLEREALAWYLEGEERGTQAAFESAVDRCRVLLGQLPAATSSRDRAWVLDLLGLALSDLGRYEEALAAAEEAVGLYRELARTRPDAFRPDLAGSLNNLGNRLTDVGRHEEALAAAEEAVELLRDLARTRPDAFRPGLARSLNNLGNSRSALGQREEALAVTEEAVALWRDLARTRPDDFRPDLGASLTNLGNRLTDVGRHEEALAAAEEAVELYRDLARTRPDAFRADLARSVANLGVKFAKLGRHEQALAKAEEAVGLYRELARARPDVFRPHVAGSLHNLEEALSALGRREEALAAAEEAARTLREPFLRLPQAHARLMRMVVDAYRARCAALGREPDGALLGPIEAELEAAAG